MPTPETVQIIRPRIDATLAAETADNESRTIDIQFYSGAAVQRYSWAQGEYTLAFAMAPENVRLTALNSGRAPILDSHSNMSTEHVLGVVEKGWIENGKGMSRARIARGVQNADDAWNKIQQGILRNVSMGAIVHKLKDVTSEKDKNKSYLAIDWEPMEISIVPIGADPGAQVVMSSDASDNIQCVVVELSERANPALEHEEILMTEQEINRGEQPVDLTAERARTAELLTAHKHFEKMGGTGIDVTEFISSGKSVNEFRKVAFDKLAELSAVNPTREHHAEITRDERDTRVACGTEAILHQMDPRKYELKSDADFRGLSAFRLAEEVLRRNGVNVGRKTRQEIAELSMNNSADFPLILENSARKRMLDAYTYATPTYQIWAKASTTPDFKTMSRYRLGESPAFLKVAEGAQITLGTMAESREQYAIATYGRGIAFTRQMLINDDMGAFNDLVSAFGVQASRLENKTVYSILNSNPAMADGVALFHATHGNSGSGAISDSALDAGVTAMAVQKGSDGVTFLNIEPRYLVVPKAKSVSAQAAMTAVGPSVKISDQNMFAGRFQVVSDAELDGTSATVWYLIADQAVVPTVEYCHLEGSMGPQIIRKENESGILGQHLYAFLDFGAKAIDWRGAYKSTGVA